MQFEVLGPLRVARESGVLPVAGRLRRGLLALLLARPDAIVSTEVLVAALWGPDAEPRGLRKLHLLVHQLRRVLSEPDRVCFESGGYRLRVLDGELDAARFDAVLTEAVGVDDPSRRARMLRRGVDLWRGHPYQDIDLAALTPEVQRLSERRLVAFEELYAAELGCGRHAAVVPELRELVGRYPLRERLCALLMTALHRSGRQADALDTYHVARRLLVDELGLEPGPELRRIQQQVLAGELDGPDRTVAAVPARPAQLPHDVPGFVGRTADLDRISAATEAGAPVVAVVGTAGVGKTALVMRWAHRARERFPDGQVYVDLRGFGPDAPLPPADVLARFLRALGMDVAVPPDDPTECAARFRTLVDRRRMLVVLDNAAGVEQVRPLLPGASSCVVLITSRDSLTGLVAKDGAHRIVLDRMTPADAESLLADRTGHPGAERAATTRLIERCARLPLALCIAAERIGERGDTVARLDGELADEGLRLDLLDTGDRYSSVRAVLSWSYGRLRPPAARLFRLCGLRPAPVIDVHAAAALTGDDLRTTRRSLDSLARAHLIEQREGGRYQQHDLLWIYAAELAQATDGAQECTDALTRLLDHYRHTASVAVGRLYPEDVGSRPRVPRPGTPGPDLATPEDAEAWLEANHAGLLATAVYAGDHGWPSHAGDLAAILARHIRRRARHTDAHRLYGQLLTAARLVGDRSHEEVALAGLGHVLRMAGSYAQAAQRYQQALAIAGAANDWNEEVIALGGLGDTLLTIGQHRRAAEHYRRMLVVAEGGGCRLGVLKALAGLGHSAMWSGRYAEGEDFYRRSLGIVPDGPFRASGLTAVLGLAHVHMLTGRYRAAFEYDREGLHLARDTGHRLGELAALAGLGELDERAGRFGTAVERYEQALDMARAAGIHTTEVHLVVRLGHVHRNRGCHALAAEHFGWARRSAQRCGHHLGVALASDGLGRTSCASGDLDAALGHHRDALAIAEELELPREQATAHDGLGHAQLALGELGEVRHHWGRAVDIGGGLGVPEARSVRDRLAALDVPTVASG